MHFAKAAVPECRFIFPVCSFLVRTLVIAAPDHSRTAEVNGLEPCCKGAVGLLLIQSLQLGVGSTFCGLLGRDPDAAHDQRSRQKHASRYTNRERRPAPQTSCESFHPPLGTGGDRLSLQKAPQVICQLRRAAVAPHRLLD